MVTSIPRSPRAAQSPPRTGVLARALGVLALFAAVVGITAWSHTSHVTAALALTSASSDVELRVSAPRSDDKAHLTSRAPSQAARARPQDQPDLRLPPLPGAALVASRAELAGRASIVAPRDDGRCCMAVHEAAPESAGHRAANPVRGPPARHLAAI